MTLEIKKKGYEGIKCVVKNKNTKFFVTQIEFSSHIVVVFLFRKCSLATFPPLYQLLFTTFPLSQN